MNYQVCIGISAGLKLQVYLVLFLDHYASTYMKFKPLGNTGPIAFPGSTPLRGIWAIGDALLGQIRWDHPSVLSEKRKIFYGEEETRRDFMDSIRAKLKAAYIDAFDRIRTQEKDMYGDKSFFSSPAESM